MTQSILFTNNSKLSILVESWKKKCSGLSIMFDELVNPGETITLYSSTGEWYIHHRFVYDNELNYDEVKLRNEWIEFYKSKTGIKTNPFKLGKFRNMSCAQGDFCWMESEYFDAKYVNGVIIFEEIV